MGQPSAIYSLIEFDNSKFCAIIHNINSLFSRSGLNSFGDSVVSATGSLSILGCCIFYISFDKTFTSYIKQIKARNKGKIADINKAIQLYKSLRGLWFLIYDVFADMFTLRITGIAYVRAKASAKSGEANPRFLISSFFSSKSLSLPS